MIGIASFDFPKIGLSAAGQNISCPHHLRFLPMPLVRSIGELRFNLLIVYVGAENDQ